MQVQDLGNTKRASSGASTSWTNWAYPLIVLVAGLLAYIPWLGSYGLLDPTDSFFLESGRELLEKNQYLLPLNNYVPWLDKPILFFWMVLGAYKCFGISAFVGRLPAALSAVATALIIYYGSCPILKKRTAAFAALIFLATPLCSIIGHLCLTDMTLCALISGAFLFLFKGLELQSNKDLLLGYVFLALAMLCKGPIAIIICGLGISLYLISLTLIPSSNAQPDPSNAQPDPSNAHPDSSISRPDPSNSQPEPSNSNNPEYSRRAGRAGGSPASLKTSRWKALFECIFKLKPLAGIAIFFAINLPWYSLAGMATNGRFLVDFFYTQNFGRMVGTVNHQEPFYFYIPCFFGGFFPWCLFTLSAPGLFKKTIDRRNNEPSKYRRLARLCLFWFFCVITIFTAIKTKLPTYILPCAPAFAILLSMQLEVLAKTGKLSRLNWINSILTVVILAASIILSLALHFALPLLKSVPSEYVGVLTRDAWLLIPLTVSLILCGIGLRKKNATMYLSSMLAFTLITCGIAVPQGMKIAYEQKQVGFNELACKARDDHASVAMVFAEEPSVPWFTHQPVSRLNSREDAQRFLKQNAKPHYVLVQLSAMARLDWFDGHKTMLAENGKWHLMDVDQ